MAVKMTASIVKSWVVPESGFAVWAMGGRNPAKPLDHFSAMRPVLVDQSRGIPRA
jgi:hypothetical protein